MPKPLFEKAEIFGARPSKGGAGKVRGHALHVAEARQREGRSSQWNTHKRTSSARRLAMCYA